LPVDRGRSDLDREIPAGVAKVGSRLAQPALPFWVRLAFRGLVKGGDESIGDAFRCGPRADCPSCVTCGLANEADPTGGSSLQLGDERWVFTFESPQRGLDLVSIQTRLLHDLVRAHDSSGAFEHLHDRSEHGQVSPGPGLVHVPIHSDATDKANDCGTLGI